MQPNIEGAERGEIGAAGGLKKGNSVYYTLHPLFNTFFNIPFSTLFEIQKFLILFFENYSKIVYMFFEKQNFKLYIKKIIFLFCFQNPPFFNNFFVFFQKV